MLSVDKYKERMKRKGHAVPEEIQLRAQDKFTVKELSEIEITTHMLSHNVYPGKVIPVPKNTGDL